MSSVSFACDMPQGYDLITLGHGGGGKLTQDLIDHIFKPAFDNPLLAQMHDCAHLQLTSQTIAVSTDSYVVQPLFFPGGDIGSLSVTGTCNDLAMGGATPKYLTCSFILTEGLPIETLKKVVLSMRQASFDQNVLLVAGDTKVVESSTAPSMYVNTTGIGLYTQGNQLNPSQIKTNDIMLISHDIGRHGLAVMTAREGLQLQGDIDSDCRPLFPMIDALLKSKIPVHCCRDLTRGGLATNLIELCHACGYNLEIDEDSIPVLDHIRAGCEMLGLDPMYMANEGCMVLFVPEQYAQVAISILNGFPHGQMASIIGRVLDRAAHRPIVHLKTSLGTKRVLHPFSGEQLPRIC